MGTARDRRCFQRARFSDGLLIPGFPSRRSVDLLLTSESVVIGSGSSHSELSWDDFAADVPAPIGAVSFGSTVPSRWRVEPWSVRQTGAWADVGDHPIGLALVGVEWLATLLLGRWMQSAGVGIALEGDYIESTRRTRDLPRRITSRIFRRSVDNTRVPVTAVSVIGRPTDCDSDMLSVLCQVLADDPERRSRLDDHDRVERLIADLAAQPLRSVDVPSGTRRVTIETVSALRTLGYTHHYGGRPLPTDHIDAVPDIVNQVIDRIRANPHSRSIKINEKKVSAIVDKVYVSIAPWPFEALLKD